MLFRLIPLYFLLLAAASATAAPGSRTGEAAVREASNGLPCFTIAEREEKLGGAPDFESVTVYDASARPRARMWTMSMPPTRTFPVLFSMCIPYAGRVQSLPQTKAAMLEAGKVYEVVIDVRGGKGANRPRGYGARFCLAKQRDGTMTVHHIGPGAPEGRNLYGCIAPK
ncbi:MAG: hypothetical protein JWR40_3982 [Massilia sp.]|jgi:hypothetical protein|nr:hypothetical protein [Massilia sp.]MDB5951927.1 hypothetical protein [Massilia sp.]